MVPPLVGQEPNLPEWLWAQNNEHRLPLQKAVYLALLKISGGDFRVGMFADTLMLAGLCLAMILTARRLRGGRTRPADAFFPLVLLHIGHMENLDLGVEIQFIISTVLICAWLLIIVRERWPLPPGPAAAAGLVLVLLPLSGANGVVFAPFVAAWSGLGTLWSPLRDERWVDHSFSRRLHRQFRSRSMGFILSGIRRLKLPIPALGDGTDRREVRRDGARPRGWWQGPAQIDFWGPFLRRRPCPFGFGDSASTEGLRRARGWNAPASGDCWSSRRPWRLWSGHGMGRAGGCPLTICLIATRF